MNPGALRDLLNDLSAAVLQTDDFYTIDRGRSFAHFLLGGANAVDRSHDIRHWKKQWKLSLRPESLVLLENILHVLPRIPLPIYSTLNLLKRSQISPVRKWATEAVPAKLTRMVATLSEEQIVTEVLRLLRGGNSRILLITGRSVTCSQAISTPHASLLRQLLKLVFCLQSIRETRGCFAGLIGDAMRIEADQEYHNFIETVSKIEPETTTLVSILARLSGEIQDRIVATTIVCESISQSCLPSILNSVLKSRNYGLAAVWSITSNMIDAGIDVLLQFFATGR
jgi:hypothetical protein